MGRDACRRNHHRAKRPALERELAVFVRRGLLRAAPGPFDPAIDELAKIAEEEASSELYGLLKRSDAKFVTERAYDNPKFVEDLVRDIALRLRGDPRIGRFVPQRRPKRERELSDRLPRNGSRIASQSRGIACA